MKSFPAVLLCVFLAGAGLALQTCTMLTFPLTTTVFGGAQLAIKGAELQKQIREADVQEAFDAPFERTWNMAVIALTDLHIEITTVGKTKEEDGGLIEGLAKKIKIKIIAVEVTPDITEIGIWTGHDRALAQLIAERIKEAQRNNKEVQQM